MKASFASQLVQAGVDALAYLVPMLAVQPDSNEGLLSWQWSLYARGHVARRNLVIHALTQPLFCAGTLALLSAPVSGLVTGVGGLVAMVITVAAQGAGHAKEATPPVPSRGPLDIPIRILAEQWITFPRFVLSGGFARAWRAARTA